jgi:hypothetical protein
MEWYINKYFEGTCTETKIAICLIHNSAYNAHTESLFKASSILPLNYLAEFFKLKFMHHYTFKNLAISYLNTWPTNAERREEADHLNLCNQYDYCSVSRWRPQKVDKRMVLEHTHGLFITLTEFRLSTTFIPVIIIIHTTGIFHHFSHSNMYMSTNYGIQLYMAHSH